MGNSSGFIRFLVAELSATNVQGVPAYERVVQRLVENGYTDDYLEVAPEVHGLHLGGLDSIGSFFEDLDALVRSSGRIDALAFLLRQPSRTDVVAHYARLPPAGVAFARIGVVVLCRDEFLELRGALQERTSILSEELDYVLTETPPDTDELDVWLTQGGGDHEIELASFPLTRGSPPRPARVLDAMSFEGYVRTGLLVLGGLLSLPVLWILFGAIWTFVTHLLQ